MFCLKCARAVNPRQTVVRRRSFRSAPPRRNQVRQTHVRRQRCGMPKSLRRCEAVRCSVPCFQQMPAPVVPRKAVRAPCSSGKGSPRRQRCNRDARTRRVVAVEKIDDDELGAPVCDSAPMRHERC